MKNSKQTTSQKHINNLTTVFAVNQMTIFIKPCFGTIVKPFTQMWSNENFSIFVAKKKFFVSFTFLK